MSPAAAHHVRSVITNEMLLPGSAARPPLGTNLESLQRYLIRHATGEASFCGTQRADAALHRALRQLAAQCSLAQTTYLARPSGDPSQELFITASELRPSPQANPQPQSTPSRAQAKYKGARPKSLPFTHINLAPRVYTSQEVAKIVCTDESTIRRKASFAWRAGDGRPQPLPAEPRWYVTGQGNVNGGRRCGWRFQQVQQADPAACN